MKMTLRTMTIDVYFKVIDIICKYLNNTYLNKYPQRKLSVLPFMLISFQNIPFFDYII